MNPGISTTPDEGFDLLRNDALIRWQRKLQIAPREGLGVVRRAIFFALVTWVPIVVWAALNRRLLESDSGEPLLSHFGIHVRCLVALPLLVGGRAAGAAEGLAAHASQGAGVATATLIFNWRRR